ncbi:hypothetical protein D884_03304 [Pseudomonas sp. URMO17WK12:I10]|nr:hypothetical protein F633_02849 [Pseudomonas sp. LAMO17WK12:I3]RED04041.1 hypothetical protein D884_03304 [Pseudomonas sp. URMO17WK12:I10]SOD10301.1 hypothetical protein SAMN05660967_03516 [Pseudomonas sp. URMO17WK12:I9]
MKVKGTIAAANLYIGRYVVRSPAGYLVMDLMQGELSLRDEVSFDPQHLGPVYLINHTTGEPVEVCVEALLSTLRAAVALAESR